MLYFIRINVWKGIDINKTCASKECDIYHYWYFLNHSFKFQPNVCNKHSGQHTFSPHKKWNKNSVAVPAPIFHSKK